MIAARSLIALFSLPAVAGFARTPDWDGMSIEVKAEGHEPPDDMTNSLIAMADDKCKNLFETGTTVLNPEWCGSVSQSKCTDNVGDYLRRDKSKTVVFPGVKPASAVLYNICAWDPKQSKCRPINANFACSVGCPGVVADSSYSARTPNSDGIIVVDGITLDPKCSLKRLPSVSSFIFRPAAGLGPAWQGSPVYAWTNYSAGYPTAPHETCDATQTTTGLSELGESFAANATMGNVGRRRLNTGVPLSQSGTKLCAAGTTETVLSNGDICCDTTTGPYESFGVPLVEEFAFRKTMAAGLTYLYEKCVHTGDSCNCSIIEETPSYDIDDECFGMLKFW